MRYRFGPFELDAKNFALTRGGARIAIQPKAFDLLLRLVERPNVVLTKAELIELVWPDVAVTKDSLTQTMMTLRSAIGEDAEDARYIETVRGRGYRFQAKVTVIGEGEPRRSPTPRSLPLIGRTDILALVAEGVARSDGGRGSFLLLSGDRGVGKTFLLHAIAEHAHEEGRKAIVVRCTAESPALWPFVVLGRELRQLGGDLGPTLTELVGGAVTTLEDPRARFTLFERIVEEIAEHAQRTLVIAFDDLHLVTAETSALLGALAQRLGHAPLVLLATYRSGAAVDPNFDAALGALTREPQTRIVRLTSFTEDEIASFVESRTGERPRAAVLRKLVEKTGGNPRFLANMVQTLDRSASPEPATSTLIGGDGMRESIIHHLAALPEGTTQALLAASVFGKTFQTTPLAAVLDLTNEALLVALDAAESASVIARNGASGYRFTYPLIRDVLYRRHSASERVRLHKRAAAALESRIDASSSHGDVGEVARHLVEAAAAGDVDGALDWSLRAAVLAKSADDAPAAARYAERGLTALAFARRPDARRRALLEGYLAKRK